MSGEESRFMEELYKMLPSGFIPSNQAQVTGNELVPTKATDNGQKPSLRETLLSEYVKSQALVHFAPKTE